MSIEWRAPFELAFELALFLIGVVAVVFVSAIAIVLVVGIIKALFGALKNSPRPLVREKNDSYIGRR